MSLFLIILFFSCLNNDETSLAKDALKKHDLSNAEKLFRLAVQRSPKNTEALAGLGWTYHLALEKEASAQSFDRCLQIEPENSECLRGRASVALSEGDMIKGKGLIAFALQANPDDPEVISTSALFDLSEGNIASAKSKYASLVSRFPERSEFLLGYSEALMQSTEVEMALVNTEKALENTSLLPRYQAMFWLLRARALIEGSAGAVKQNCQQREQVLKWIEEAERSLAMAKETGVELPNKAIIDRQVLRRKSFILEKCPIETE
jgi:Tfp pilus assembly protein PilF